LIQVIQSSHGDRAKGQVIVARMYESGFVEPPIKVLFHLYLYENSEVGVSPVT
jgi:hypothetical protein